MDPISATAVHWAVWEPFAPKRSRVPSVSIDLLQGIVGQPAISANPAALLSTHSLDVHPTPEDFEHFLRYILSDDTTLPSHPLLTDHNNTTSAGLLDELAKDEKAESEFESADEVSPAAGSKEAKDLQDEGALWSDRRSVIEKAWIPLLNYLHHRCAAGASASTAESEALRRADSDYGTVLYGAYGCIDDAQWASSCRSVQCRDLHDMFMLLRMSGKLASDIRKQLGIDSAEAEDDTQRHSIQLDRKISDSIATAMKKHCPAPTAIIRLTQHKGFAEGVEFRAFVLIERGKINTNNCSNREESPNEVTVLGLCQKRVDQVFDFLLDSTYNLQLAAAAETMLVKLFTNEKVNNSHPEQGKGNSITLCDALFDYFVGDSTTATATHPAISDIVVGIDIIIESPTLPIYILGMSAVAVGTKDHPFLTDEQKTAIDGYKPVVYTSNNEKPPSTTSNPFQEIIIDKQSIPFCRLYQTLANLRAHYIEEMMTNSGPRQRTIFVATEQSDLIGDGKQMFSHTALPKELTDTEALLGALQASQQDGGMDPTSLAAFMRHLQSQQDKF